MTALRRLLIYEREPLLAPLLTEQVKGWYPVSIASIDALEQELPAGAAVLVEEGDHMNLAMRLRRSGFIGPIFSLSDDEASVTPPLIRLAKPFRMTVLLARLEAPNGAAIDGALIGPWRIDAGQRALIGEDGRLERLTDKEFDTLKLLLLEAPACISRERLQGEIWQYHAESSSHTVETHVWRLRQKIESDPAEPRYLVTDNGGYRLKTC